MVSTIPEPSNGGDQQGIFHMHEQLNINTESEHFSLSTSQIHIVSETPLSIPIQSSHDFGSSLPLTPKSTSPTSIGECHDMPDVLFPHMESFIYPPAQPSPTYSGHTRNLLSTPTSQKVRNIEQASSITIAPPLPLSACPKPKGLTGITVSDANDRSVPPAGSGLLAMVENAKRRGKIPKIYDSSVVRCVDGTWLVPQMCASCQELAGRTGKTDKRRGCDRTSSCFACRSVGSECRPGNLMIALAATKKAIEALASQGELSTASSNNLEVIPAVHIGQKLDGTWACSTGGVLDKTTRADDVCMSAQKFGSSNSNIYLGSPAKQRTGKRKFVDDGNDTHAAIPAKIQGRRRKSDDNDSDFVQSTSMDYQERRDEDTSTQPISRPVAKRNATAKRAQYVKYHMSMQDEKKPPVGEPPVWAEKRQNLCEALPYYKAYMSAAYMHDRTVRAFMVDKEVGPRDKFEEEILIARVGGGRKLDEQTGKMVQKADQHYSTAGLGFERAKETRSPIAVIAGQGNRISPSRLPHYYNVLDWFHVTDVWCERSEGFKCWMVRLEKINLHEKSWWAPIDSPALDPNRYLHAVKAPVTSCTVCNRQSKHIYKEGWACLETSCAAFFNFNKEIEDATLDYTEEFLKERTQFVSGTPLPPLAPPPISMADVQKRGDFGYESIFGNGLVCPLCKGCSRRIEWRRWACETSGCNYTHCITQETMRVSDAITGSFSTDKEFCDESFGIRRSQKTMGMYDVFEYTIPGLQDNKVIGVIRHFQANGIINAQPHGPNDLFREMQVGEFYLKRHPVRQTGSIGEMLTSHWAANWGAPYKFGVSVRSKSFAEAPLTIIKALKRLTWAGDQTVTDNLDPFIPFNELLSLGYFEESAISYHDDGEKELGPTVATLSLGGQALMALRPKAKSGLGRVSKNAKGTKGDVLRIVLRHGDLVVMHGSEIQKLYEHAVSPQGKLRFALTSRYVRPELMANDEERRFAEINSKLPEGHEQYEYTGDLDSRLPALSRESDHVTTFLNKLIGKGIAGELDMAIVKQCSKVFDQLINGMNAHGSNYRDEDTNSQNGDEIMNDMGVGEEMDTTQ